MPLQLDEIKPAARDHYRSLGAQYGPDDVRDQGQKTANALTEFGSFLRPQGFVEADTTRLGELLVEHAAGDAQRESKKIAKKTTNKALVNAMLDGKKVRRQGRSVLLNSRRPLFEQGQLAVVASIDSALAQTQSAGADPAVLATQLKLLQDTLTAEAIAAVAAERGGTEALAALQLAADTLRSADQDKTVPRGTPTQTAHLDLIEGMIIVLVRDARRAARAAADALGRPEIAKAFELDELYGRPRRKRSDGADTDVTP